MSERRCRALARFVRGGGLSLTPPGYPRRTERVPGVETTDAVPGGSHDLLFPIPDPTRRAARTAAAAHRALDVLAGPRREQANAETLSEVRAQPALDARLERAAICRQERSSGRA